MSLNIKHYLWTANLLIAGLVIWLATGLAMTVLGDRLRSENQAVGRAGGTANSAPELKPLGQYEAISRSGMFGGGFTDTASKAAPAPRAVSTEGLNLRLKGIIRDPESGYAMAVLESPSGEQNLYRVGDDAGGAKVTEIQQNSVNLEHNGRETRLELPMDYSGDPASGPAAARQVPASAPATDSQEADFAQEIGDNRFVISRGALEDKMGDLNYFLSQVMIQPNFSNGQPDGFRVTAVRGGSPIYQLGLRQGDVIKSVNDVSANNPNDLINLYRQVMQLDTVTVEIMRGGQPLTLTYSMR